MRNWDSDARAAAYAQARDAAAFDPDAAGYLLDCLEADAAVERDTPDERDTAARVRSLATAHAARRAKGKPFDPMRLFARVAKYYGWSDADVRRTPWPTLLGYAREADLMQEDEQRKVEHTSGGALAPSYRDASFESVMRRLGGR